ncbi:MAG: glycyl-radical enzyme activating protein [Dehalococcoidales bacterium]|nr:glycyl-radical enzyme activating protein [Dehalococcoidales bacterium]
MSALVTNIQGYSIHDGPGIRTVVFLKGCGLACRWCSNPECISPQPEVGFYKSLCTACGKCAGVCSYGALSFESGQLPRIDRERCTGCGACSSVCDYKALVLFGRSMSAEEIFDIVHRDKIFYDPSGGGVTLSGGECLLQPELVCSLFDMCRKAGIHTCIETSGHAPGSALREVLRYSDYVLFDLKHQEPDIHRRYTGQTNDLILASAGIAADSGVELLFRMPLIPGINDDRQNIADTAKLLKGLRSKTRKIELMPYHRLGKGKYESLDKQYAADEIPVPQPVRLEQVREAFENLGIECTVSA